MAKIIQCLSVHVDKELLLSVQDVISDYKKANLDKKKINLHSMLVPQVEKVLKEIAEGKIEKFLEDK